MDTGPRLPAGVEDPLPQQQLRQPVPGPHQIPANVLPGPHQVPRGFLLHARHRDLGELVQLQQPSQQLSVSGIGLHPVPVRTVLLRRRTHHTRHTMIIKVAVQAVAGRAGLVTDLHRTRQASTPTPTPRPGPGSASAARSDPCPRPAHARSPTRRAHPTRRTYDRFSLRPPATVALPDSRKPARQPTTTCERGLSLPIPSKRFDHTQGA